MRIVPISLSGGKQDVIMPYTCIKRLLDVAIRVPMHQFLPTSDAYAQESAWKTTPLPPSVRQLSPKHVHFLFLRHSADLKPEEQKDLHEILHRNADLAIIYQLVQHFREMLHARRVDQLNDWIQQVLQ